MKRRIDATGTTGRATGRAARPTRWFAGHNVKLGQGGIREIEFMAQTLQLVWGGRDPRCARRARWTRWRARPRRPPGAPRGGRARRGLPLPAPGRAPAADGGGPADPRAAGRRGGARRVRRCSWATPTRPPSPRPAAPPRRACSAQLPGVFERLPDPLGGRVGRRRSTSAAPATGAARHRRRAGRHGLRRSGTPVVDAVRGWQAGRVRALRSERARELMRAVLPALLAALARQPQPDAAFARFDASPRPPARRRAARCRCSSATRRCSTALAGVLGAAPSLADYLARTPRRSRGCCARRAPADPRAALRARLADARDLEEAIAIIRAGVREEDFAISVATMEGADRCRRRRRGARAHGRCRAGRAARAGAGRFRRPLRPGARRRDGGGAAGQGGLAGNDGRLRPRPDVRLRPSGGRHRQSSGPRAAAGEPVVHPRRARLCGGADRAGRGRADVRGRHAAAPVRQQGPGGGLAGRLQALPCAGRTRLDLGTHGADPRPRGGRAGGLRGRWHAAITRSHRQCSGAERIRADAAAMRARLARDLPPDGPWDVKLRPGGQIEVEFIAQALHLVHARREPGGLCHPTIRQRWPRCSEAGVLAQADAAAADPRRPGLAHACRACCASPMAAGRRQLPAESARPRCCGGRCRRAASPAPVDLAALRATLERSAGRCARRSCGLMGEIVP